MNLKQQILKEFPNTKFRLVKYYKQSPYQKKRYKPEYVKQEVWLYTVYMDSGYCITEETYNDKEYWQTFKDMIIEENKQAEIEYKK